MAWVSAIESPSRCFFTIILGWLLGIFVSGIIGVPLPIWLLIIGLSICLLAVGISWWQLRFFRTDQTHPRCRIYFFTRRSLARLGQVSLPGGAWLGLAGFLFFFFAALLRFSLSFFPPDAFLVSDILNREVRVEGIVADDVIVKAESQQVVVDQVRVADQNALGKILVAMPKYPTIGFGDLVAFRCDLEIPEPFNGFAYDKYLRARGVLAVCWWPEAVDVRPSETVSLRSRLFDLKHFIDNRIERVFTEPQSTLLSGLLFGGKGAIDQDLRQDFATTGAAHILAASGYNVGIFSRFLFLFLVGWFFNRRVALAIVAGMIGLYMILAGLDPSIVRAGIMGLIIVGGRSLGRAKNNAAMRNILALTAGVMLLFNPRLLLDDVGFQLSFMATIGLTVIAPRLESRFQFIPTIGGFREAIVATVAATIMTLPILIYQFGQLSVVSLLVNFLILPLVPYAMGLGAIAISVSFLSVKLAVIVSVAAWACLTAMLDVIRWFAALPLASVSVPFHRIMAVFAVVGLIVWLVRLLRTSKSRQTQFFGPKKRGLAAVALTILLAFCFAFQTLDSRGANLGWLWPVADQKMKVWFFDVGQGDAAFIQTPDNRQILIDGGPGETVLSKLGAVMPFWDRAIDTIVLTHPHSDHISGLIEVLDRYQVDQIVMTGVVYRSIYLDAFDERVVAEGATVKIVDQPMNLVDRDIGDTVSSINLAAVFPTESYQNKIVDEINETSIVTELIYGQTSLLFTGDVYSEQDDAIVRGLAGRSVDAFKVPHHGSISSTSVSLLDSLNPNFAVISVGQDNIYGHPHPIIEQRLRDRGVEEFRTDLDGDVLLISDGKELSVEAKPLMF